MHRQLRHHHRHPDRSTVHRPADVDEGVTSCDPEPELLDGPDGGPKPSSYPRCADGAGTLTHLFFSEADEELARAKAICRTCGLAESCRAGAIDRGEVYGVWGGTLVLDGVPVEVKRKRGRPRRHPAPALVVDEIPLPDWVA